MCLVGMTAMAQKGERHQNNAKNDMTPEQMATLKTKQMTWALDLTNAQQKQIQTLNLENAKTRKAAMDERKARKETKKPTSDERYAKKNERLDRMIVHKAEMKNILSTEQYDKWEKMAMRKGKHRKGMHYKGKKEKQDTRK